MAVSQVPLQSRTRLDIAASGFGGGYYERVLAFLMSDVHVSWHLCPVSVTELQV